MCAPSRGERGRCVRKRTMFACLVIGISDLAQASRRQGKRFLRLKPCRWKKSCQWQGRRDRDGRACRRSLQTHRRTSSTWQWLVRCSLRGQISSGDGKGPHTGAGKKHCVSLAGAITRKDSARLRDEIAVARVVDGKHLKDAVGADYRNHRKVRQGIKHGGSITRRYWNARKLGERRIARVPAQKNKRVGVLGRVGYSCAMQLLFTGGRRQRKQRTYQTITEPSMWALIIIRSGPILRSRTLCGVIRCSREITARDDRAPCYKRCFRITQNPAAAGVWRLPLRPEWREKTATRCIQVERRNCWRRCDRGWLERSVPADKRGVQRRSAASAKKQRERAVLCTRRYIYGTQGLFRNELLRSDAGERVKQARK